MNKLRFAAVGFGDTEFPVLAQITEALGGEMTTARTHEDLATYFEGMSGRREDVIAVIDSGSNNMIQQARMDCRPDTCGTRAKILMNGTC